MIRQCLVVIILSGLTSYAQDSLVRYNEIKFDSEFEKDAFRKYLKENNSSVAINLLLATTPDGPAKSMVAVSRIDEIIKKFESAGIANKKPEKQTKTVSDQVRSTFLTSYHPFAGFAEIFPAGIYNSVTATALYALIFDRLKIPYAVQEKPTNVFLVTYPEQQKISIETTPAFFSYRMFDAAFQEAFIKNLKDANLINSFEVTNLTVESQFIRHFFARGNIGLPELIGLHYLNDAYRRSDNNDFIGAFRQCEKSYLLYPTNRCTFSMTSLAAQVLQDQKLSPKERAWFIAKVSRYSVHGITPEVVQGEFLKLNEELLVRQNDRFVYETCADIIVSNGLQEDEMKNAVRYLQYYELGRADYNQGRYNLAKQNFAKALDLQPNNTELSATFLSTLLMSMRGQQEDAALLDTVLVYKRRFPSLNSNNNFNSVVANAYLFAAALRADKGDISGAEAHQKQFESMVSQNPDLRIDSFAAGTAYSKLSAHYFKKGQKEKARSLLKKGLEIAPDNYELRRRQQMLN